MSGDFSWMDALGAAMSPASDWDFCPTHGVTTLADEADTYGCGCPVTPSSRPSKGEA